MPHPDRSITESDELFPESHYPGYPEATRRIRERVQARTVVMNGRAWQVLRALSAWQVT